MGDLLELGNKALRSTDPYLAFFGTECLLRLYQLSRTELIAQLNSSEAYVEFFIRDLLPATEVHGVRNSILRFLAVITMPINTTLSVIKAIIKLNFLAQLHTTIE